MTHFQNLIHYLNSRLMEACLSKLNELSNDSMIAHVVLKKMRKLKLELQKPQQEYVMCCVGQQGVGKSYLLNTLLGKKVFPSRSGSSCTAVPVELRYHQKSDFRVVVEYMTLEEWHERLDTMLTLSKEHPERMYSLIKTVYENYGNKEYLTQKLLGNNEWNLSEIKRLLLSKHEWAPLSDKFGREVGLLTTDALTTLKKLATGYDAIKLIRVYSDMCNWLGDKGVLVDLPGSGDADPIRGNIFDNYITTADHLFICVDQNRALSDPSADFFLSKRQDILMNGRYMSMSIVITKCDHIDEDDQEEEQEDYIRKLCDDFREKVIHKYLGTTANVAIYAVGKQMVTRYQNLIEAIARLSRSEEERRHNLTLERIDKLKKMVMFVCDKSSDDFVRDAKRELKILCQKLKQKLPDKGLLMEALKADTLNITQIAEYHIGNRHHCTLTANMKRQGDWTPGTNTAIVTQCLDSCVEEWDSFFNKSLRVYVDDVKDMVRRYGDDIAIVGSECSECVEKISEAYKRLQFKQITSKTVTKGSVKNRLLSVYKMCAEITGEGKVRRITNLFREKAPKDLGSKTLSELSCEVDAVIYSLTAEIEKAVRDIDFQEAANISASLEEGQQILSLLENVLLSV